MLVNTYAIVIIDCAIHEKNSKLDGILHSIWLGAKTFQQYRPDTLCNSQRLIEVVKYHQQQEPCQKVYI